MKIFVGVLGRALAVLLPLLSVSSVFAQREEDRGRRHERDRWDNDDRLRRDDRVENRIETIELLHEAADAFDLALRKLGDFYLSSREKSEGVVDAVRVAVDVLERRPQVPHLPPSLPQPGGFLLTTISKIDQIERLVLDWRDEQAVQELRMLENGLYRYPGEPALREAIDLVRALSDALSDRFKLRRDKEDLARLTSRRFKHAIVRSDAYQFEFRGSIVEDIIRVNSFDEALSVMAEVRDLVTRDQTRKIERRLLEIERYLTRFEYDADILQAQRAARVILEKARDKRLSYREPLDVVTDCARVFCEAFQALRITARDDMITIFQLEVEFESGGREYFSNISLTEESSTYVELQNTRDRVRAIRVTATSSNI